MRDLADYQRYLTEPPEECGPLVSVFLIKVTEFLRDPELFAVLREKVLPAIVEAAREHRGELRNLVGRMHNQARRRTRWRFWWP